MFRKKSNLESEIKNSINTKEIMLNNQSLVTVPELISDLCHVKSLDLSNNNISYLDCDKLPPCIEQLFITNNCIKTLDFSKAPKTLKIVYAQNNKIDKLITTNSNISCIFVDNNNLKEVDRLSDSVIVLKCSKNKITTFKDLNKVQQLSCANNCIKHFKGTKYLRVLDISNNCLESITDLNKNMDIVAMKSNRLIDYEKVDKSILFAKYYTGLPKNIDNSLKSYYATIIQSKVKTHLAKKKYNFLKLVRDINDINSMKPNAHPKLLKVYFKNPNSKIVRRYLINK